MAYQTGTANSFADLQTTIETFCQANGWTKTGVVLHKGASYIQLSNDTDYLDILGGTGQSSGSLTGGATQASRMGNDMAAVTFPATYHLFAHSTPDTVICILHHDAVLFQWVAWGEITKEGVWNGGNWFGAISYPISLQPNREFTDTTGYVYASGNPQSQTQPSFAPWWKTYDDDFTKQPGNCQIWCDLDGGTWLHNSDHAADAVYSAPAMAPLVRYSKSLWNEQTVLIPPILFMKRPSNFRSALGMCGHFRFCRVDNYAPGDIITIGADQWMLFPFHKKDLDDTSPYYNNTGPYGWAIAYDGP